MDASPRPATKLLSGSYASACIGGARFTLLDKIASPQTSVAMTLRGEEVTEPRFVDSSTSGWPGRCRSTSEAWPRATVHGPEPIRAAMPTFRAQSPRDPCVAQRAPGRVGLADVVDGPQDITASQGNVTVCYFFSQATPSLSASRRMFGLIAAS
jgi:hypothetical protein